MMINKRFAAALIAAVSMIGASAEQTSQNSHESNASAVSENLQPVVDLAKRIKISGYVQGGYDYSSHDNSNSFNFKRTIVWAKADITDKWSFLYMHDFKSSTLEYYTAYRFCPAFSVRLGQFKSSLSLENPMSPSRVELIDCYSQPVRWLVGYSDPLTGNQGGRDLGLLFYGNVKGVLNYEVAIMNGQGINKADGNSDKDFLLKLDCRIAKPLRVVASGQLGRGHAIAADESRNIAEGQNYKRNRITAGAELTLQPLTLRAEWLKGWDGAVQSQGVYATAMAPLLKNIDAVGSFDWLDKNTRGNSRQANYTVGLQYWFYNKCRIQAQVTRCCPSFGKDYNMIQVQTQVGF